MLKLIPKDEAPAASSGRKSALRSPLDEPDSFASTAFGDLIDRGFHAGLGRMTGGLSIGGISAAFFDWAIHLSLAPGKQFQLQHKAWKKSGRYMRFLTQCALDMDSQPCAITPLPHDKRFTSENWQQPPFNFIANAFLLQQQWWHVATTGVPGVSKAHEKVVSFTVRQLMDIIAPSNYPWLNPDILEATAEQSGQNFIHGWSNFLEDVERLYSPGKADDVAAFRPGHDVAITPGKIVYSNDLIELIHYTPTQKKIGKEPLLIVPAWIMKYYILDLEPQTSLVRYLVDKGHDVYCISWKNPGPEDREFGLLDYMNSGVFAALDAIGAPSVHAAGYCLGGTLLAATAALMARNGDKRLKTITLLAGQVDFSEAGELTLFIGESQVNFLEGIMWEQGYLDAKQMAGAFQLLRSNDLIWSRLVHDYMVGERQPLNAMMAWNADTTRMPFRMHSDYLRKFFLENALSSGSFCIDDRPVSLTDIRAPIFALGTEFDHVAPWRSVYKIHLYSDTDITFALASGGHNGGVVSAPERENSHYRIYDQAKDDPYVDPDHWTELAAYHEGSWWAAWSDWLAQNTTEKIAAPTINISLPDAPGQYIHQT